MERSTVQLSIKPSSQATTTNSTSFRSSKETMIVTPATFLQDGEEWELRGNITLLDHFQLQQPLACTIVSTTKSTIKETMKR